MPCVVSRAATCASPAPPAFHADVASTSRTAFSLATGSGSFGAMGYTRLAGSGGGAELVVDVGVGVVVLVDGDGVPELGGAVTGPGAAGGSAHPARPNPAAPRRRARRPTVCSGIPNLPDQAANGPVLAPHTSARIRSASAPRSSQRGTYRS